MAQVLNHLKELKMRVTQFKLQLPIFFPEDMKL